jgi:SpoVK/Ycf46/Vps4 family AAA+-type ATPase
MIKSRKSTELVPTETDDIITLPSERTASDNLLHELTVATDASIGVIAIRCPETEVYRVVDDIYSLAQSQEMDLRIHTSELGWSEYAKIDPEDTRAEPFDPMMPASNDTTCSDIGKAFAKLYGAPESGLPIEGFFVFLDLYFSFDEMRTVTRLRKQAQLALNNGQRLFVVVPNSATIPDSLAPLMHIVEFGFPSRAELADSLEDVLGAVEADEETETVLELTNDERDSIVAIGAGMTVNSFETAIAVAVTEYTATHMDLEGFGHADIMASIRDYKTQLLRKTNVLELQTPIAEDQIGGLDLFKDWMHERKRTYSEAAKANKVTPSRGALVVGPPGTGKSLVAKAAGSILKLPVIRFDVGRVFGQFIGQSETAMRGVLTMIDAMAPCVLMLDEIDKGFSGMGGGAGESNGGTTQRVFGTFLTWMQERNQLERPVFLIMTANRVEGLPPELLRKGRVDEIWSVNVPNETERAAILDIHLRLREQEMDKGDLKAAVRLTEGLVGAELEALIEDALVMSLEDETPEVTFEWVERARGFLKEMGKTRKSEFKAMEDWAKINARPASTDDKAVKPSAAASGKPKRNVPKRNGGRVRATPKRPS